jgi:hypothetical protein
LAEVGEYISLVDSDSGSRKGAAVLASATKEHTTGMRVDWVEMEWLIGSSARKVIAGLPM